MPRGPHTTTPYIKDNLHPSFTVHARGNSLKQQPERRNLNPFVLLHVQGQVQRQRDHFLLMYILFKRIHTTSVDPGNH